MNVIGSVVVEKSIIESTKKSEKREQYLCTVSNLRIIKSTPW